MNLENVLSKRLHGPRQTLSARDCMLYALGIGIGQRPDDPRDLQYVYEKELRCFPAMVNVLSHPGPWLLDPELGLDYVKLLHGEQGFVMHAPLRADATYVAEYRFPHVVDKGRDKGALLFMEKMLRDAESGELVSTVTSTLFLRGDGGGGGTRTDAPAAQPIPDRACDLSHAIATSPRAALVYRLSGDYNALHVDPAVAAKAGFERPILHGLCSMAVATRSILSACCGDDPGRLKALKVRFSSPVYPGETLVTDIWHDGDAAVFRTRTQERDATAMTGGRAEFFH